MRTFRIILGVIAAITLSLFIALVALERHVSRAGRAKIVRGLDGPYVLADGRGGWRAWSCVLGGKEPPKVSSLPVAIGDRVSIAAVGDRPAFDVVLRPQAVDEPDEASLPAGSSIFLMADTHGQYEIATELLEKQHIIDGKLHWAFGKGRLVVLGDVFDRGPHQTEIFWLIYRLEGEAALAGGRLYFVLGNHEVMEMDGDERYLDPRYQEVAKALGKSGYSQLWAKDTLLGQWLRTKPTVLRLGRLLCLHGGISIPVVDEKWTIANINRTMRASLCGAIPRRDAGVQFLNGPLGPLWYRGYFQLVPKLAQAKQGDVEQICRYFNVDRIAVGHTIVPAVTLLSDGKVIALDVNMEHDASGRGVAEGVLVNGGAWYRADIDGTEVPL